MSRVAIIAAMPGELKPLVRGWFHTHASGVDLWRWSFDEGEWIAACAGAGADAARRAFAAIECSGPISYVISTGWAGALNEELKPGQAFEVSGVVDSGTGERFHVAHWSIERLLVPGSRVAGVQEKQRLASTYGAALVDMEAAAVARLAAMRGVPFYCYKGVSDGLTDRLPDFNRFISLTGRFNLARFILFALFKPIYWPALLRMGENSRRASESIAESLFDFLDERAYIRERNGYPNLKS